jgi:hypothetical protein
MADKYITSTLHNLSPVPADAIYRGDGVFDYVVDVGTKIIEVPVIDVKGAVTYELREITIAEPYNIDKKLAEYDTEKGLYYKDPSIKYEIAADAAVIEKEKTEEVIKIDTKIDDYLAEAVAVEVAVKP